MFLYHCFATDTSIAASAAPSSLPTPTTTSAAATAALVPLNSSSVATSAKSPQKRPSFSLSLRQYNANNANSRWKLALLCFAIKERSAMHSPMRRAFDVWNILKNTSLFLCALHRVEIDISELSSLLKTLEPYEKHKIYVSLVLTNKEGSTSIPDFPTNISNAIYVAAVDLSQLKVITSIGNSFFADFSALKMIDLLPLKDVTSIGSNFLFGCSGLTDVDMSSFNKVASIPLTQCPFSGHTNDFLGRCTSLNSWPLSKQIRTCLKIEEGQDYMPVGVRLKMYPITTTLVTPKNEQRHLEIQENA